MKKNKHIELVPVSNLRAGDRFQIVSVKDTMRNMEFISTTNTSTLIKGQKRDTINDSWKPFQFHISNGVMVYLTDEIYKDSMENTENATATAAQTETAAEVAPKRRGRPRKARVAFNQLKGVEGEFTVKDVVTSNGMKDYEVHNLIRSEIQDGKISVVKELTGGRGKPRKVYRLV